jgi:hypothetical protein
MDKIKDPTSPPQKPKKPYRAPVLSEYGDVRQLTSGGGGANSDAGGAMTKKCWIAEALYGYDTPRVLLVRGWLTECYDQRIWWALAIVPLYVKFGERVAAAIRVFPGLGHLFRPVFDRAVLQSFRAYGSKAVLRSNGV